jgi:hypothetical protein
MIIRRIKCIPLEIDTGKRIIKVTELDDADNKVKSFEYSVHGMKIAEDFQNFLGLHVWAALRDEKIFEMEIIPEELPPPSP